MCPNVRWTGRVFQLRSGRLIATPEVLKIYRAHRHLERLGRWKRIYRAWPKRWAKLGLTEGTLLKLHGVTGEATRYLALGHGRAHHVHVGARQAAQSMAAFDGLIPELLEKYRTSKSTPQINQLEKYMSVIRCPDAAGEPAESARAR